MRTDVTSHNRPIRKILTGLILLACLLASACGKLPSGLTGSADASHTSIGATGTTPPSTGPEREPERPTVTVNTPGDGFLALKDKPCTAPCGKTLLRIPHTTRLELGTCTGKEERIDGANGQWCQTRYAETAGWVFDGFTINTETTTGVSAANSGSNSDTAAILNAALKECPPRFDGSGAISSCSPSIEREIGDFALVRFRYTCRTECEDAESALYQKIRGQWQFIDSGTGMSTDSLIQEGVPFNVARRLLDDQSPPFAFDADKEYPLRGHLLDVIRTHAQRHFKQPVTFKVNSLRVTTNGWAFFTGKATQAANGRGVDYRRMGFANDYDIDGSPNYCHHCYGGVDALLRNSGNGWRVVEVWYDPSDVYWQQEGFAARYGAPRELFEFTP